MATSARTIAPPVPQKDFKPIPPPKDIPQIKFSNTLTVGRTHLLTDSELGLLTSESLDLSSTYPPSGHPKYVSPLHTTIDLLFGQTSATTTTAIAADTAAEAASISSFAKSYNSEDPSALSNFSDSMSHTTDWPVESAWDALVNKASTESGPARLTNNQLSYIPNHFFDGLHSLKELYLDKNLLRDLPEELLKLSK